MPVEKSAGAVIFSRAGQKTEYLLIKNSSSGRWGFPKGIIEKGEEIKAAAAREAGEEAGLEDLEFIDGFKETVRYFMKAKYQYQLARGIKPGQMVLKFVTYLLAQSLSREIKLSFEHDDFAWLELAQAEKLLTAGDKKILERADEFLKNRGEANDAAGARRTQDDLFKNTE